jgi:hypothetical protein
MNYFHKEIIEKWQNYSIFEQMANIGAEVGRAINWNKKHNFEMSTNAFYRALELIDLTVEDKKNKNSLKEILRLRELIGDYFIGKNIYHSDEKFWEKYFYPFNLAARKDV